MTASTRERPDSAVIRPYEPRDRAAVRDIACRTAFRNMGSDRLFEDREIHADYWTKYYTDYRPADVLVIEEDGAVIGYFFGLTDHAHFARVMGRRIVPSCLGRALWRWATGRYEKEETKRYIRHALFHAWKEAPELPYGDYPATYHFNILRQGYGRGYYTELVLRFLDRLEAMGIHGIHGHITEPAGGKGIWHRFDKLCPEAEVQVYSEKPNTLFRYVLGDRREMVNRGWAVKVEDYRIWTRWLREHMRL